jgi:hypothetical protein
MLLLGVGSGVNPEKGICFLGVQVCGCLALSVVGCTHILECGKSALL